MPFKDPDKRREYNKQYHKRWYGRNRGDRIEQVRRRKAGIREWMRELKESLACMNCGLSGKDNAWALEFHHRNHESKDQLVSSMVASGLAKKRILAEIEKCDVVCSNCHRKSHYTEHRKAVESGGESIWSEAGKAGAAQAAFSQDEWARAKKRRRKRRKQRQREKDGTKSNVGPDRQTNDDIDTYLLKLENGVQLTERELVRFRRLVARQKEGHLTEGETPDFTSSEPEREDIEFNNDINPDSESEN